MNAASGPFDPTLLHEVAGFLYAEAACLDDRDFTGWLALMTDDVTYRMPVRATRMRLGGDEFIQDMAHYDETRETLTMRVQRLGTPYAWAEDPPSRTRHFVTNVRVQPGESAGEYAVRSNVLVYRNRGDSPAYDLLSAERHDRLRRVAGQLRLAARVVRIDQSTLGTLNLAIFI